MTRSLRAAGSVAPEAVERVAYAAGLETLEDVLHARFDVLEVIVQDEFTHDVITCASGLFVVFDTT